MKKIKKIAVLFGLTLMLGSMPVFAENVEQVSVSENENIVSPRSNRVTYGARTIANGGSGYFKSSTGGNLVIPGGAQASFNFNLSRSAKIQVRFYDTLSGQNYLLFSGTAKSKTIPYYKNSKSSGYFIIVNKSGSSLKVNSASVGW